VSVRPSLFPIMRRVQSLQNFYRGLGVVRNSGLVGLNSRPVVVDPHPTNYHFYSAAHFSVGKPNRKEAELATGIRIIDIPSAKEAAKKLLEIWDLEMSMITLGEDGLVIFDPRLDEVIHLETEALSVFDVSGAGDTVTSVFTAGLAVGCSSSLAGQLANIAAGIVVAEVGTAPIELKKFRKELEGYFLL
jgi:D-beta-D-heptose 7-phosphate kinase / D-beta-D-heptose 1-phosphate adenosyltransferase